MSYDQNTATSTGVRNTTYEDCIAAIDNGSEKFILLTTRAGGLEINLMTMVIVVLYDSDWYAPSVCIVHHGGQRQGTDARAGITEAEGRSARYTTAPDSAGEQYIR